MKRNIFVIAGARFEPTSVARLPDHRGGALPRLPAWCTQESSSATVDYTVTAYGQRFPMPLGHRSFRSGTGRKTFAVISLRGKVRGLHACGATLSYILPLLFLLLSLLFSK